MVYRKNKIRLILAAGLLAAGIPCAGVAQQPPQENQIQCISPNAIIRAEHTPIMADAEGNIWFKIKFIDTGKLLLGFYQKKSRNFCIVAEGKINPES